MQSIASTAVRPDEGGNTKIFRKVRTAEHTQSSGLGEAMISMPLGEWSHCSENAQ